MSERARRIADNEQRFRVFNNAARDVGQQLQAAPGFSCECGDEDCSRPVSITADEYRHVRRDDRWFVVLPEHERPDVERVVERHEHYLIVQKIGEGVKIVQ
jgi:hypothetical protein